jgi:hypothetical protein
VLVDSDVIVIGNKGPEFHDVPQRARPDQVIVDLVRITEALDGMVAHYQGICW